MKPTVTILPFRDNCRSQCALVDVCGKCRHLIGTLSNRKILSPAYDVNPVTPANGLHLNITDDDNSLNYELAMEVIDFFRLDMAAANKIKNEVLGSVREWKKLATDIGIARSEQQMMASAFNL